VQAAALICDACQNADEHAVSGDALQQVQPIAQPQEYTWYKSSESTVTGEQLLFERQIPDKAHAYTLLCEINGANACPAKLN
jgi:hypothetical protein